MASADVVGSVFLVEKPNMQLQAINWSGTSLHQNTACSVKLPAGSGAVHYATAQRYTTMILIDEAALSNVVPGLLDSRAG